MSIPKNRLSIHTNLPTEQLDKFLNALEAGNCTQVPGSDSLFAGSAECQFVLEDATYTIHESFEVITSVNIVSGNPIFVQSLIDELEVQLSKVVNQRKYGKAERINEKITDLKRLLIVKKVSS